MKQIFTIFLVTFLIFSTSFSQGSWQNSEFYTQGYPKQFAFRGEYYIPFNVSYTTWVQSSNNSNGVIRKFVPYDELPNIKPITLTWAQQFIIDFPQKLVLEHWDAKEHVNNIVGSSDRYFPGHWLTCPGTKLSSAITATSTAMTVDDVTKINTKYGTTGWKFPTLLLVETDALGNRNYNNYEYVQIQSIINNVVTIERGVALSKARSFAAGMAVLPLTTRMGNDYEFQQNFATTCPKDKNGKTCADIQLAELKDMFDPINGAFRTFHGIAFDVIDYDTPDSNADVNGDGISDKGGIVNGNYVWRDGMINFQNQVRSMIGVDKILTSDGYNPDNQRLLGIMDGIESEGLVEHNDGFRGYAKTLNIFQYWNNNNTSNKKIGMIVTKFDNVADTSNSVNLQRLLEATATCLDAAVDNTSTPFSSSDEMLCGTKNKMFWLGNPIAPMSILAYNNTDLFGGQGVTWSSVFRNCWALTNCTSGSVTSSGWQINATKSTVHNPCVLTYNNFRFGNTGNDLVFAIEIQSSDSLPGLNAIVPRIVNFTATGLPQYETNAQNNNMYNAQWGFVGKSNSTTLCFYFRNAGNLPLNLTLSLEDQVNFIFKSIKVYDSPLLISRQYEHGLVLANASLKDTPVNLTTLTPNIKYHRIKGNELINDGTAVGSSITVPALNGLFLLKDETTSLQSITDNDNINIQTLQGNIFVNLKNKNISIEDLTYSICSLDGKILLNGKLNTGIETTVISSQLQKGVYLIFVKGKNFYDSRKIIIY